MIRTGIGKERSARSIPLANASVASSSSALCSSLGPRHPVALTTPFLSLPPEQVITGAGRHSVNNVPLIKNAVLAYLKEESLRHHIDPTNEGVVLVRLGMGN